MSILTKGDSMIKKFMKELFEKKVKGEIINEHEIDEETMKVVLYKLDTMALDMSKVNDSANKLSPDDAKALRELNGIRLDNKKARAEIVEKVAKALGITIGAAAAIVSAILAIKYFKIDVEWLKILYDLKDSTNVPDKPTSSQVMRMRDDHRKGVMSSLTKGIKLN